MLCLLNKFVLFTNQKQPLKCVRQNSYLHLWSYALYIMWQWVHLLANLQAGGTNKLTTKAKSLIGIPQGFDKCIKATLQNNYFWRTPPEDYSAFEIWSRYHYYNIKRRKFKAILIWRSSRKMNRNKNFLILYYFYGKSFPSFPMHRKKFSMLFLFNFVL